MKGRTMAALALALCLAVPLGGCRARIIDGDRAGGAASDRGDAPGENREAVQESDDRPEGEPGSGTRENPEASRREYDENATAEITAGTDRLLHAPGEGDGAPRPEDAAELSAAQTDENADETAEQTVAAPEADRMGVSEDAEEADSAMTYYTVLLQDRLGTLFECQRATAYWETADDHVTVYRTSPEHAMILEAGCYDASARLLAENLKVDDGWVARKNPGLIVKVVRGDVLGEGDPGWADGPGGLERHRRGARRPGAAGFRGSAGGPPSADAGAAGYGQNRQSPALFGRGSGRGAANALGGGRGNRAHGDVCLRGRGVVARKTISWRA